MFKRTPKLSIEGKAQRQAFHIRHLEASLEAVTFVLTPGSKRQSDGNRRHA